MTYSAKNYSVVVRWSDSDKTYNAECEEIPGCFACDDDKETAVKLAYEAIESNLEITKDMGLVPPAPITKEYSGKVLIRMPRTLHKTLAKISEKEGISLNQLMTVKLAQSVASESSSQQVLDKFDEWIKKRERSSETALEVDFYLDPLAFGDTQPCWPSNLRIKPKIEKASKCEYES